MPCTQIWWANIFAKLLTNCERLLFPHKLCHLRYFCISIPTTKSVVVFLNGLKKYTCIEYICMVTLQRCSSWTGLYRITEAWKIIILTHWGRVTHIWVSKLTIIGSDSGLAPGGHQAIIWTSAGILLIEPSGAKFSEILIEIRMFSFKKMRFKISSVKVAASLYRGRWATNGPLATRQINYSIECPHHKTHHYWGFWQDRIPLRSFV